MSAAAAPPAGFAGEGAGGRPRVAVWKHRPRPLTCWSPDATPAARVLAGEGLVEVVPGRGVYVTER